jgi:hypothetical protein
MHVQLLLLALYISVERVEWDVEQLGAVFARQVLAKDTHEGALIGAV